MAHLTLAVSDELLAKARHYAVQHRTSVDALLKTHLEELVGKQCPMDEAAEEFLALSETYAGRIEPWSRDELYEP